MFGNKRIRELENITIEKDIIIEKLKQELKEKHQNIKDAKMRKSQKTFKKVINAIIDIKLDKKQITNYQITKYSGVSKNTLKQKMYADYISRKKSEI